MVDEFMVCVDRIIVSSIQVNSSERETGQIEVKIVEKYDEGCSKEGKGSFRECRICQEEDDEKDMEAPCACNGTLKNLNCFDIVSKVTSANCESLIQIHEFAHRKCIQRWCNKKGDITCEICYQVFSPNYTCPPPRNNADVMAIDISQAWGPHVDLRDPRFLAFAAAERQFLQSEYDEYTLANSGALTCFRSVAITLMLILLVRQTLLLTRDFGLLQDSSFFSYQISVLQLAGFLLPCYVVARSWYFAQLRRRRQG